LKLSQAFVLRLPLVDIVIDVRGWNPQYKTRTNTNADEGTEQNRNNVERQGTGQDGGN